MEKHSSFEDAFEQMDAVPGSAEYFASQQKVVDRQKIELQKIADTLGSIDPTKNLSLVLGFCTSALVQYAINGLHSGRSRKEVGENIGEILTQMDENITKSALEFMALREGR